LVQVWASKTVEVTLDVRFYSGVRQTLQDGKVSDCAVAADDGLMMRVGKLGR
jgi:hypothetical protein